MRTGTLIIVGLGAAVALGVGYVGVRSNGARTIRLNNPGALKINPANAWVGKITPSRDPVFETFETPLYGARAMLRTLRSHYARGENTINMLINYWSADNRAAYAAAVKRQAGLSGSGFYTWERDTVVKIAKAMADFEAGIPWFSENLFRQAWELM